MSSTIIDKIQKYAYLREGKEIPLRAWAGPEGSRGLRLPDFKTLDACRW
jgi:hypothetical protein